MLFIWGTKAREKALHNGVFFCPDCDTEREYTHKRIDNYFTAYWIPLFKIGTLGEAVECAGCGQAFDTAVLSIAAPTPAERITHDVRQDLETGTPLQMAYRKLVNLGTEEETAAQIVYVAATENLRLCTQCGMTYVEAIHRCALCGNDLQAEPPAEWTQAEVRSLLLHSQKSDGTSDEG
ncbi:MAG: hypothetical protein OHK0029_40530 [Armatimonadaceae bacterium]